MTMTRNKIKSHLLTKEREMYFIAEGNFVRKITAHRLFVVQAPIPHIYDVVNDQLVSVVK